mmetsp:Transcript_20700/g.61201  ORF Transcript_20700/g.61201 Transcript_20700/m.61201 type:complete len:210 (-) Transcript_20700:186-815(-)
MASDAAAKARWTASCGLPVPAASTAPARTRPVRTSPSPESVRRMILSVSLLPAKVDRKAPSMRPTIATYMSSPVSDGRRARRNWLSTGTSPVRLLTTGPIHQRLMREPVRMRSDSMMRPRSCANNDRPAGPTSRVSSKPRRIAPWPASLCVMRLLRRSRTVRGWLVAGSVASTNLSGETLIEAMEPRGVGLWRALSGTVDVRSVICGFG